MSKFSNADVNDFMNMLIDKMMDKKNETMITLGAFISEDEKYIQNNRSYKYFLSIRGTYKKLLKHISPEKKLNTFTRKDCENILEIFKINSPKGYRIDYRNLKASFNRAVDWGYISENPFNKIKLPREQKLKPVFLTKKDFEKIKAKIKNKCVRDVSEICFYTGLRLSEAVNLKWKNVNLNDRILTIGDATFTTKTREQREVPMNEKVYSILNKRLSLIENKNKGCLSLSSFVFAKNFGRPFTGDYVSRQFKKAVRKAGLYETIHFHSLRHSAASNMANKGVQPSTVQEILGHKSIVASMIYTHIDMASMRKAVESL